MRHILKITDRFECAVSPCGSRVTCDPPPTDTDQDWLVFVPDQHRVELIAELVADGWAVESGEHYADQTDGFISLRKGEDNLIVSSDEVFCIRHMAATVYCKEFNLLDKKARVTIFKAVLYGGEE